jgi:hypothetical protein
VIGVFLPKDRETSTSEPQYTFSKVTLKYKKAETDKVIEIQVYKGSFELRTDNSITGIDSSSVMNTVIDTAQTDRIKILFNDVNRSISFVSIVRDGEAKCFEIKNGPDIFIVKKDGKYSLIFEDLKKEKIKGSITAE